MILAIPFALTLVSQQPQMSPDRLGEVQACLQQVQRNGMSPCLKGSERTLLQPPPPRTTIRPAAPPPKAERAAPGRLLLL